MIQNTNQVRSLQEYRVLEANLHRELISCCRKYLNELGIVSVLGLIDVVKQEIVELERATKSPMGNVQDSVNTNENELDRF